MTNSSRNFTDNYVLGKTLGRGSYSVVRKCRHKFSRQFYACKIISLNGEKDENEERKDMIENEVKIIRKLKHENILGFVDIYFHQDRIMMITQLNEFGDLHDFITSQEKINESLARILSLEVCAAVNYLHSKKIVHRDIKPENFLMYKRQMSETFSVKLCDFGLSVYAPTATLSRVCGSPSYVAPEIINLNFYGIPADIWSMGVVFYFIICRFCPFEHENLRQKFDLILLNELRFPLPAWQGVSGEAKDLIIKMLKTDPLERVCSSKVMYDKWFQIKGKQLMPTSEIKKTSSRKMTFKNAATVVSSTRAFMNVVQPSPRQKAVVSSNLLKDIFSI